MNHQNRLDTPVQARRSLWQRQKQWLRAYRWLLIGLMWVLAALLGYIGFSKSLSAISQTPSFWDTLYLTLQLFVLQSGVVGPIGWELQVARFLAPLIAAYTVIEALALILHEQSQLFRLRFMRNHIVICGLGRKGLLLSRCFREQGERVVVVEQDENNEVLGRCREYGATTLIGNATDPELLRRARVHKAKYVISVSGNDGVNAEVAVHSRELARARKGEALSCLVHIFDIQLCNLLREQEIGMGEFSAFRLEFFNVFESGARALLAEYPPFAGASRSSDIQPHVVVVGVGRMGESVVVNTARIWWETNGSDSQRPRITLVDREAESKRESLCLRYPQLEIACKVVPRQMDVKSPEFERAEFLFDGPGCCDVTIVYVCLDDDSNALGAALALRRQVRDLEIPMVVRMTHDAGLATLLEGRRDKHDSLTSICAFGLLDRTCTPDSVFGCTHEILARAIHEEYVCNERERGILRDMNPSMAPWDELPESLKESNRDQAEHIRVKLDAVGCDIAITTDWDVPRFGFSSEETELMAEMEHERFVRERLHQGFRYGPTKDLVKKTSPTLVPWSDLPEHEKDKDRNFVQNLPGFLARARFRIYRVTRQY